MTGSNTLASIEELKAQARRLRATLAAEGTPIGHSRALELLAHQHGYRDWNALHAALGNRPAPSPVAVGDRVRGRYLSQPFEGEVIGVQALATPDRFRVTLQFDAPIDVVTFDSFSAYRQRVTGTIDRTGRTAEKTSDGRPHLELAL